MAKKIMVVDDEREFTEMLALRLRKTGGYETVEVYDGEAVFKLVKEQHPDLILLDIMLPKKDGYEVLLELKKDNEASRIPVIILTASSSPPTTQKFIDAGVADFVSKPFDPPELMAKIKKALGDV